MIDFYIVRYQGIITLIKAIDSVGDPPLPIPNREVKPDSADGTANICGRVGHRHFFSREFQAIETLFFLLSAEVFAVNPGSPAKVGGDGLSLYYFGCCYNGSVAKRCG